MPGHDDAGGPPPQPPGWAGPGAQPPFESSHYGAWQCSLFPPAPNLTTSPYQPSIFISTTGPDGHQVSNGSTLGGFGANANMPPQGAYIAPTPNHNALAIPDAHRPQGVSHEYIGYPTVAQPSPWSKPAALVPQGPGPGPGTGATPWNGPGVSLPPIGGPGPGHGWGPPPGSNSNTPWPGGAAANPLPGGPGGSAAQPAAWGGPGGAPPGLGNLRRPFPGGNRGGGGDGEVPRRRLYDGNFNRGRKQVRFARRDDTRGAGRRESSPGTSSWGGGGSSAAGVNRHEKGDVLEGGRWMAGPSCTCFCHVFGTFIFFFAFITLLTHSLSSPSLDGPVLTPILVSILSTPARPINIQINTLLQPPRDWSSHPFLIWNMLLPPGRVARSDDGDSHMVWTKGRDAPATWPRVSQLKLICKRLPGLIVIDAGKSGSGHASSGYGYTQAPAPGAAAGECVTCGDVIEAIHDSLMRLSSETEFYASPPEMQRAVGSSYMRNRSSVDSVYGDKLGEGMRRLDWLLQETVFGGIIHNETLVGRVFGLSGGEAEYGDGVMSCVFELRTERIARWHLDVIEGD
jgi:hypothetical protein